MSVQDRNLRIYRSSGADILNGSVQSMMNILMAFKVDFSKSLLTRLKFTDRFDRYLCKGGMQIKYHCQHKRDQGRTSSEKIKPKKESRTKKHLEDKIAKLQENGIDGTAIREAPYHLLNFSIDLHLTS